MNFIDLTILIVVIMFSIRGIIRGFVLEITSLVGLIAGYLVAMLFLDQVTSLILNIFPSLPRTLVQIVSFLLLFIGSNLLLKLLALLLTKTLKLALLGWLNRLLGGLAGLTKSVILMSMVVFLLSFLPFFNPLLEKADLGKSNLYPVLNMLGPKFYHYLSKLISVL
jgi:membrane protein required for colicin V production